MKHIYGNLYYEPTTTTITITTTTTNNNIPKYLHPLVTILISTVAQNEKKREKENKSWKKFYLFHKNS